MPSYSPSFVFVIDLRVYLPVKRGEYQFLENAFFKDILLLSMAQMVTFSHLKNVNYLLVFPDFYLAEQFFAEVKERLLQRANAERKAAFQFEPTIEQLVCNPDDKAGLERFVLKRYSKRNQHVLYLTAEKVQRDLRFFSANVISIGEVVHKIDGKKGDRTEAAVAFLDIDDTSILLHEQGQQQTVINPNLLRWARHLQRQYTFVDFVVLTARVSVYSRLKSLVRNFQANFDFAVLNEPDNFPTTNALLKLLKSVVAILQKEDAYHHRDILIIALNQVEYYQVAVLEELKKVDVGSDVADSLREIIKIFHSEFSTISTHQVIRTFRMNGIPLRIDPDESYRVSSSWISQQKIERLVRYQQRQTTDVDYHFFDNDMGVLTSTLQYLTNNKDHRISLYQCIDEDTVGICDIKQLEVFFRHVVQHAELMMLLNCAPQESAAQFTLPGCIK